MTHLRKMMLEELQRRNYSQTTTRSYLSDRRAILPSTSTSRPISSARTRSGSIRLICSRNASWRPRTVVAPDGRPAVLLRARR